MAIGIVIGPMLFVGALFSIFAGLGMGMGIEEVLVGASGNVVAGLALIIVSIVLWLVALFAFLIPAFSRLKKYNAAVFGTPATLIKIGYAVGLIIVLVGFIIIIGILTAFLPSSISRPPSIPSTTPVPTIPTTIVSPTPSILFAVSALRNYLTSLIWGLLGGLVLIVLGTIFLFIGFVGLIIGCFSLNARFHEPLFLVAGILFIIYLIASILVFIPYVSAVAPVLGLIAWILMYVAAGSSIHRLKTRLLHH